ncbi:MAG: 50S ribosomal protein L29 [Sphaerochaetaceae bacterium]|jgi:large subunit ribosomal protein L29|nr:50S ribosomal protein L29 [Sphaerochaetaceae bacterium]MDD3162872.1 50S ribosomal protein L29 [Sphaerochaetaceae bacterium]MDD4006441.1 50S ribosomal protein L29 [Sphaerochaetaceae bacterium]MDD4396384.1 50S ribosomal protein L29 [Sphaerochaetaceae bacterium]
MKNSYEKLSYDELVKTREDLRKEYLDLRMNKVISHLDNPLALRNTKRKLARLNTIIHEYSLGIRKNK